MPLVLDRLLNVSEVLVGSAACRRDVELAFLIIYFIDEPGNTKGGSITVPLTSCLTGLELLM